MRSLHNFPTKNFTSYSPGDEGEFEKVVITSTGAGICTSEPCLFEKGSNITMDITFEASKFIISSFFL